MCAARCSAHAQHNRSRAVDGDVFLNTWVQSCVVYICFKNTDLLVCSLSARLQTCKSTYKFLLQKQPSMQLNKHLSCSNCFVLVIPCCRYILLNVLLFLCTLSIKKSFSIQVQIFQLAAHARWTFYTLVLHYTTTEQLTTRAYALVPCHAWIHNTGRQWRKKQAFPSFCGTPQFVLFGAALSIV